MKARILSFLFVLVLTPSVVKGQTFSQMKISSVAPTVNDIPVNQCVDWKNTTDGTTKHYCNDNGTLISMLIGTTTPNPPPPPPPPPPSVQLQSIKLNPSSVVGGSPSTGTVTLSGAAPAGGAAVALSSKKPLVVPTNVTVPFGLTSANFSITTGPVAVQTQIQISGTYVTSQFATLTLQPPGPPPPPPVQAALASVSLLPASVLGGNPSQGTVTLTSAAPLGGAVVTLQSTNPPIASVPGTVTVLPNSTNAIFTVTTAGVSSDTSVMITGTYNATQMATLGVTAATLPPPPPATGNIWVNGSAGSDSNPGTQAQPFKTIQKAADMVNPGDTVIVQDGVYTDSPSSCGANPIVCLNRGGAPGSLVTFKAEHKWGAKLDATKSHDIGFRFNADYIHIEGFEITGTVERGFGGSSGIELYNGGVGAEIVGNHIHDTGKQCLLTSNPNYYNGQNGIYSSVDNVLFDGNVIHDVGRYAPGENGCQPDNPYWQNHDHGLYQGGGNNNLIRNNIFYNNKRGWDIQGSGDGDFVLNNTFAFANPDRAGAIVDNGLSNWTVENNIFYQKVAWYGQPTGGVTKRNLTTESSLFGDGTTTDPSNILNMDPKFQNALGFDFHLMPTSPAIGKGLFLPQVKLDAAGKTRHNPPSIGAFEP
jgi:hypothetical protein